MLIIQDLSWHRIEHKPCPVRIVSEALSYIDILAIPRLHM